MGYVEENLLPGEKIVYKAQPHWILFSIPVLTLGIGILLFLLSFASEVAYGVVGCLVCMSVGLLFGLTSVITYFTTEFGLTNNRIIAKKGLIQRRSIELVLTQVESIGVDQPILGRILNYGTISVVGTGGTRELFRAIVDPMELRKRVHVQLQQSM